MRVDVTSSASEFRLLYLIAWTVLAMYYRKLDNYLAESSILEMLGVDKNHSDVKAGNDVNRRFLSGLDQYRVRTEYYLEGLLDRGIDILLYVGAYDYICNWVGIERMIKTLAWEDSPEFHKQEWREWYVDGKGNSPAGRVKNYGRLTFLTVNAAGHFVRKFAPSRITYD